MPYTPAIFANTLKLQADVQRAARSLGDDVVHINFEPGFDTLGFASLFFNIVLTDQRIEQTKGRLR
jgi:hypothetical protein